MFHPHVLISLTVLGLSCHVETTDIRLADGSKPNEGRLESLVGNTWGTVCGSKWTYENTQVVCRQLGYPGAVTYSTSNTFFGIGTGPVHQQGRTSCVGSEYNIHSCPFQASDPDSCGHADDVAVICQDFGYQSCYRRDIPFNEYETALSLNATDNDVCLRLCQAQTSVGYVASFKETCTCLFTLVGVSSEDDSKCNTPCPTNLFQTCGGNGDDGSVYYSVFSTSQGFCNPLQQPTNGFINTSWFRYGSVVTFGCDHGFELIGEQRLQCLGETAASLNWNGTVPTCREKLNVELAFFLEALASFVVLLSIVLTIICAVRRTLSEIQQRQFMTMPFGNEHRTQQNINRLDASAGTAFQVAPQGSVLSTGSTERDSQFEIQNRIPDSVIGGPNGLSRQQPRPDISRQDPHLLPNTGDMLGGRRTGKPISEVISMDEEAYVIPTTDNTSSNSQPDAHSYQVVIECPCPTVSCSPPTTLQPQEASSPDQEYVYVENIDFRPRLPLPDSPSVYDDTEVPPRYSPQRSSTNNDRREELLHYGNDDVLKPRGRAHNIRK